MSLATRPSDRLEKEVAGIVVALILLAILRDLSSQLHRSLEENWVENSFIFNFQELLNCSYS